MNVQARTITRMRPSLACVPCKRKKVKCNKQKPECGPCKRSNTACVYEVSIPPQTGTNPRIQPQITVAERRAEGHPVNSSGDPPDVTTSSQTNEQWQREQQLQMSPVSHSLQWVNFPDSGGIPETPHQFDEAMAFMEVDVRNFSPYATTLDGFNPPGTLNPDNSKTTESLGEGEQDFSRPLQRQQGPGSVPMTPLTTATTSSSIATSAVPHVEQYYYQQGPKTNYHHYLTQQASPRQDRPYPGSQESAKSNTAGTVASTEASSNIPPREPDNAVHSMNIDDWKSKPWRYKPTEAVALRLAGPLSDGKQYQGNYFTAPFWLWSGGQESDAMLEMDRYFPLYRNKSTRRSFGYSGALKEVPSKKLCDVLLRAFLLGVHPLLPLLSTTHLNERYHAFWARRAALDDTQDDDEMNDSEVSFICLLWCLLFAGAVSASPAMLSEASLRVVDRAAFEENLSMKAREALEACCGRDLQFPSLDGLVVSLILHHCDCTIDPVVEEPPFIARCFQAAHRLGLHRETALAAMPPCDAETGRRVWNTLLEMQVMASLRCGVTLWHDSIEDSFDTQEPSNGQYDEADGSGLGNSTSTIVAAAQRRMTHVLRRIFEGCGGVARNHWRQPDYDGLEAEMEQFDSFIDETVARLAVRSLPERGQISSQLLGANPLTHGELYVDNANEATVLNAFCRIRLTMMKYTVSITFNRIFLDSTLQQGEAARLWGLQTTNCVQFLRNCVHLAGLPAFEPYQWYCLGRLDAWQECMIVLSFLRNNPQAGWSRQLLLHVLSHVLDTFDMLVSRRFDSLRGKSSPRESVSPRAGTWEGMRRLYELVQNGAQRAIDGRSAVRYGTESRSVHSADRDRQSRTRYVESSSSTQTKKRRTGRTRSPSELLQISNTAEAPAHRTVPSTRSSQSGLGALTPESRELNEDSPRSQDGMRHASLLVSSRNSSSSRGNRDMMTLPQASQGLSYRNTIPDSLGRGIGGRDVDDWLGVIEME